MLYFQSETVSLKCVRGQLNGEICEMKLLINTSEMLKYMKSLTCVLNTLLEHVEKIHNN